MCEMCIVSPQTCEAFAEVQTRSDLFGRLVSTDSADGVRNTLKASRILLMDRVFLLAIEEAATDLAGAKSKINAHVRALSQPAASAANEEKLNCTDLEPHVWQVAFGLVRGTIKPPPLPSSPPGDCA